MRIEIRPYTEDLVPAVSAFNRRLILLLCLRGEIVEMLRWRAVAAPLAGTLAVLGAARVLDGVNGYALMAIAMLLYAAVIAWLDRPSLRLLLALARPGRGEVAAG